MESPQLYDSSDYKKTVNGGGQPKGKTLYNADDYSELAELSAPEISLDLHGLIDDSQFGDNLITEIQGLTVDKNNTAPRGLGVNMYNTNTLPYIPQPVHGGSQFSIDRQYDRTNLHSDRPSHHIKEEPQDGGGGGQLDVTHEYSACARVGMNAYAHGGYAGMSAYSGMTPTTVPGSDGVCKSPLRSPSSGKMMPICKKNVDKGSDEYKRRRERNNIAVRKSREKAKARTRETEERVKKLIVDNERLIKKCELLSKEVAVFHSVFANVHYLPENIQRELRKQMDNFNREHQHLVHM